MTTNATERGGGAGFTPGPWEVRGESIVTGDSQYCIAVIEDDGGYEAPQRTENARLISAAPEMYAALQSVRTILNFLNKATEPWAQKLLAETDAALAKAEGKVQS
jgi:hypothetical protein